MGSGAVSPETIQNFQRYLLREERAEATITKYLHDVRVFSSYLAGTAVTKERVIGYKDWLKNNYSTGSVNSMLAAVNSFLMFSGWEECKVKLLKVQRQLFCEEQRELEKSEYFRLVQTAREQKKDRLVLILQTLCSLGLRISELRFVRVNAIKCGKLQIYNKGKNRNVILPEKLRRQLLSYCRNCHIKAGEIFITRSGKSVDRSNIWREMKKLCEAAKVMRAKIFPHNLRHLFARTYYELKKDVVKLADIMGHSNIETTRIYTMTSGKEYKKQMENLGLVL